MSFSFKHTELPGLYVITMHTAPDNRGVYQKSFEANIFRENGLSPVFTECSDIYSKKGVLRGLHYQTQQPQAKLLHVICGALYDVALDINPASATFGKWHGELLRSEEHRAIYVPEGYAHGFLALEENTIFSYQCTGKYIPAACGGIAWDDPRLGISWPLDGIDEVILSDKDRQQMSFEAFRRNITKEG